MEQLEQIQKDIDLLKERNKRVEADKAWETSVFRVISITLITYIIALFVMWGIGAENPLTGALIPTIGYFLSTQSLPIIKRWWIGRRLKR